MRKWKESGDTEYDCYVYEECEKGIKTWSEMLSKTSLNESEYLKMLEDKLLEKAKILRRDNQI